MKHKRNIVLIGMPGSGKSTIGVLLAKALGYRFVDTDLIIQAETGSRLQTLLGTRGTKGFLQLEEEILSRVKAEKTVIATGGSAVFGPSAMAHMRELGTIVYLDTPVDAPLWETYGDYNAREEMQKEFCDRLAAKVGI